MSYYATRVRTLRFVHDHSKLQFPTQLQVDAVISPEEFFQEPAHGSTRVVIETGVDATMTVDMITGRMHLTPLTELPPLHFEQTTPAGDLTINGRNLTLRATITDIEHLGYCIDYLSINLAQFLSVYLGLFVDVVSAQGTIGQIPFEVFYPANSIGLRLISTSENGRIRSIQQALRGPDRRSSSFPRLTLACGYFHHALRLSSPHEIAFPASVACGEVMLNLAKTLEVLAKSDSRERLRSFALSLGLTPLEIESQVVPITLFRNELDIAHSVGSPVDSEKLATYRLYVDRSIENIASMLQRVIERIRVEDGFLPPLVATSKSSRERFATSLTAYLANPGVSTQP